MRSIFIPKKLNIGDTTYLADQDSAHLIAQNKANIESIVNITTPFALHKGRIVFADTASIEVEILSTEEIPEGKNLPTISLVQGISKENRFHYFFEKSTEVGVTNIFPVETEYSGIKKAGSKLLFKQWEKAIHEAMKQSRTRYKTKLWDLRDLEKVLNESEIKSAKVKICLTTESTQAKGFAELVAIPSDSYVIATGPEKGWSPEELDLFTKAGFKLGHLGDNILRTETAGVVSASIINFVTGQYK